MNDDLIPPQNMIEFVGSTSDENFKRMGKSFLRHFLKLGNLQPEDKVLDVGCGVGRLALPLIDYLQNGGAYEGFDIVAPGIEWCEKNITPKYKNFRFHLADVYNQYYNPNGKYQGYEYKFPYPDEEFDFIFLTSVFTHLLLKEMENYLSEIARVLKPGGRCFITFFLLNSESIQLIEANLSSQNFQYNLELDGKVRTTNPDIPESAIALDEEIVRNLYQKYNLEIIEPIHYGMWCDRQQFLSYQDIIVAVKN